MKSLFLIVSLCFATSYTYAQSKNYKFCRENITANIDYAVVTKFTVKNVLSNNEIQLLKNHLYSKSSVYAFATNSKRTEIHIYHLSQVHYEDLKLLVQNTNIELNFVSTEITEFREINTATVDIER